MMNSEKMFLCFYFSVALMTPVLNRFSLCVVLLRALRPLLVSSGLFFLFYYGLLKGLRKKNKK